MNVNEGNEKSYFQFDQSFNYYHQIRNDSGSASPHFKCINSIEPNDDQKKNLYVNSNNNNLKKSENVDKTKNLIQNDSKSKYINEVKLSPLKPIWENLYNMKYEIKNSNDRLRINNLINKIAKNQKECTFGMNLCTKKNMKRENPLSIYKRNEVWKEMKDDKFNKLE